VCARLDGPGVRLPADRRRAAPDRAPGQREPSAPTLLLSDCGQSTPGNVVNRGAGPDDLVARNFTAPAVDVRWLTDITETPDRGGTLWATARSEVIRSAME
jgi:hypothetical protein